MGVQHGSEETVGGVSLESADRTGSDHQGLGLVGCLFPRPKAQLGSRGSERGLWVHGSQTGKQGGRADLESRILGASVLGV